MKIGINIKIIFESIDKPINEEQRQIIKKLQEKGHTIAIVVTTEETEVLQEQIKRKQQAMVEEWLKANEISYDSLVITSETDRDICVNNGINYMVKDVLNENTFESISKLTGYASIDRPWEVNFKFENINLQLPEMTIFEYIYQNNKHYQDNIALEYFGRKISYKEFFENVIKTKEMLLGLGIKENDIVSIIMPTTPETVYLFYAISEIGAVSNMIDPRTGELGIKEYITEADSKIVFCLNACLQKATKIIDNTNVKTIVSIAPTDSLPIGVKILAKVKDFLEKSEKFITPKKCNILKWSLAFNSRPKEQNSEFVYSKNKPVAIVHTGGTTGTPKGVVLSNENFNALAHQFKYSGFDFQREHKWLDIMPPFIAYGVGNGLHVPLASGMEVILIPKLDAKKFDQLIIKYEPNHMGGVPTHWEHLIASKKLSSKILDFLITAGVGGDGLNPKVEIAVNEFLSSRKAPNKIAKGYGTTELNSATCGSIGSLNKLGSVGIPFIKNNISIFEPNTDAEKSYNEVGEVCITGPTMMLEYYKNPKATSEIKKMHHDGREWIHTQDLGYIDENGFLFIIGRIKRMIIKNDGFKVFPTLIEKAILSHPSVEKCIVVGIKDPDYDHGQIPVAHIILKNDFSENISQVKKEIENLCIKILPEYVLPGNYIIRNSFPFTSIGKVDFMALQNESAYDITSDDARSLKFLNKSI